MMIENLNFSFCCALRAEDVLDEITKLNRLMGFDQVYNLRSSIESQF